jgi:Bacterial SH3 domain
MTNFAGAVENDVQLGSLRMMRWHILAASVLAATFTTVDTTRSEAANICKLPGTTGKLSLRKCPSLNCKVKGAYREGTYVNPVGYVGRWIRVKVKGKQGYMADKYLCGDDIDFG